MKQQNPLVSVGRLDQGTHAARGTRFGRPGRAAQADTRASCAPRTNGYSDNSAGFSMIEMIGVMAILAILASVLAPAGLRTLERAAVRAEASTLKELAEQIRLYARDSDALPGATTWTADLTAATRYSSLNASEILTNKRQVNRLYVVDVANRRAMIISSMRTGVAMPSPAQVLGNFQNVWNTPAGQAPAGAGWNAWNANNVEFLQIERVNCQRELQTFPVSLKNSTPGPAPGTVVSYVTIPLSGQGGGGGTIHSGSSAIPLLRTGDRIQMYLPTDTVNPNYIFIVGSRGASFEFNGTTWFSPSSP